MFSKRKENNKNVDYANLNEVLSLGKKILKIAYILVIVVGIYILTILFKEWKIGDLVLNIFKILAPLFVGLIIAWLFDPIVSWLQRKGIKRGIGTAIVYIVVLGLLTLIICTIIPLLADQVNEFVKSAPAIFDTIKHWVNDLLNNFSNNKEIDIKSIKSNIFDRIEDFGATLTSNLPTMAVNGVKSFASGAESFVVGLIIGFFLLVSFSNANELFITLFPKAARKDARDLTNEVNTSLRKFVQGAIIDCSLIFVVTSIGFAICGLKAPLLFGLFCGITNIIPYAGPYIGGAPAVIVGFSQGTPIGIFTLITIFVIQFLEGNFLQPMIMSKTTKLHPVTIILGLLIFGHFFGIIGMAIATPIIASLKAIVLFFDEKYEILPFNQSDEKEK